MIKQFIRRVLDAILPETRFTSEIGVVIHVRANGTTWVDSDELRRALANWDAAMGKVQLDQNSAMTPCDCCVPDPCYGNSRCIGKSV